MFASSSSSEEIIIGTEIVTSGGASFWTSAAHPQLAHLPQLPHPLAVGPPARRHPRVQVAVVKIF